MNYLFQLQLAAAGVVDGGAIDRLGGRRRRAPMRTIRRGRGRGVEGGTHGAYDLLLLFNSLLHIFIYFSRFFWGGECYYIIPATV